MSAGLIATCRAVENGVAKTEYASVVQNNIVATTGRCCGDARGNCSAALLGHVAVRYSRPRRPNFSVEANGPETFPVGHRRDCHDLLTGNWVRWKTGATA